MSYLGVPPFGQTVRTVTTITATASQTTFTPTGGYTVGYCDVYYNGIKLVGGTDFTATDGLTVVLTTGATANAVVEIITYGTVSITDAVRRSGDTFSGAVTINSTLAAGNTTITGNTTTTTLNSGNTAITGTLAAGNTTITGTANVSQGLTANTLIVSTNTATFGTAVYHVANGNVGIGTNAPAYLLDANGIIRSQPQSGSTNNTAASSLVVSNKTTGAHAAGLGASIAFEYVNSGGGYAGGQISSVAQSDPFTADMVFYPRNYGYSEALRLTSAGVVSLPNGQLKFPASQNASSDANTLDDYEEGTFTATLTSTTPPSSPPTTTAYYTKIGRMVTVAMRFGNVNTSGGSGAMYVTGLPFTPTTTPADCYTAIPSMHYFSFSGYSWVVAYASAGSIYFLMIRDNNSWSDMPITAGTGKYLQFSLTYQVA